MIVICSYSYSQSLLSVPAVTSNHSGLLHKRYFLFWGVKKENCQNRRRSAEVTSISFPSTRRENRNKECPLIEVMTFIPWMHGSEVQLIDSVSWQSCLIWSHKGKKKNEGETFELKLQAALSLSGLWKCGTFCITVWKLHRVEMSGWNVSLWRRKHQSGMSRGQFPSALVREQKDRKRQTEVTE